MKLYQQKIAKNLEVTWLENLFIFQIDNEPILRINPSKTNTDTN